MKFQTTVVKRTKRTNSLYSYDVVWTCTISDFMLWFKTDDLLSHLEVDKLSDTRKFTQPGKQEILTEGNSLKKIKTSLSADRDFQNATYSCFSFGCTRAMWIWLYLGLIFTAYFTLDSLYSVLRRNHEQLTVILALLFIDENELLISHSQRVTD